jgi:DNA-directed RNA polymerase specialized sigma24 family protein
MAADRMKQRAREVPMAMDDLTTTVAELPDTVAERDALRRALHSLPPDQALAVHLRMVEDYSFAEVARLMGKSPAACQMLVLRAGRSLRATLRREGIHA